MKLNSLST